MRRLTSSIIYFIVALIASAAPANAQDPFSRLFTSNGADQELFKAQRLPDWSAPQNSGPDPFNLSLLQGSAQRPPEREHTGLAALVYTTAADFKAFPKRRSTWVILAIGGAAAALAHPADDAVNEQLVGSSTVGR
ncbi:MAG: hypothetical protein EHM89_01890, partial [Acidobacteria bacterium]